jgi:superfamily II DNA or RNA helicase
MEPKFHSGQTVRKILKRDQVGTVLEEPKYSSGTHWYKIKMYDQRVSTIVEDALELYSALPQPDTEFLNFSFSDHKSLARIITYNKLVGGYLNNPTSFKASKTLFRPHQYKPLLKFLYSDNQRLLIADEVGLGKTIEAGYIMLELEAREKIKKSFIICPKSLCVKWEREMREKFGMEYEIKYKEQILRFLNEYERGTMVKRFLAIVSYQTIRNPKIRERLAEVNPEIDLVIMDEMHWARNETSQTNKLARQISQLSNSVLGLTATPIMLGNQNLYNLLNILNPFEFQSETDFDSRVKENIHITAALKSLGNSNYEDTIKHLMGFSDGYYGKSISQSPLFINVIDKLQEPERSKEKTLKLLKDVSEMSLLAHVVTRTRRKDTELKSKRKAQTYKLRFTDFEKKFYDAVTSFIQGKYSLITPERRGSNFALMMPQRQMASCIPAMINYYKNKETFLQLFQDSEDESDLDSFNDEVDDKIENQSDSVQLIAMIKELTRHNAKIPDSKFNEFINVVKHLFINEPNIKILVFSYFKATLKYLQEQLDINGFPNYLISGDLTAETRQQVLDDFRNRDDKKILLSSEVGSEGLDLEFCSVVINYDLPWNPMVVEQRIGRADRFGQKSEIITIVNFSIDDTIEARILDKLYERIQIFEESIGDLENILGDEVQKLTVDLLSQKLTPKEQEERIEQVADLIVNQKLQAKKLEEESSGLLTNDEYFQQELNSIITEKRYLTQEEMFIYINEFMAGKYPDCKIKKGDDANIFDMYITDKLEFDIRESLKKMGFDSPVAVEFYRKVILLDRKIKITFDAETAFLEKNLEYINAFHPITVFITDYFRKNLAEVYPASAVTLRDAPYLQPGNYYYATFEQVINGGRSYKTLSNIIIDDSLTEVASPSEAAEIIGGVISRGEKFEYRELEGKYDPKLILGKLEEINFDRFQVVVNEINILNESAIQKQTDISSRIFNGRVNRLRETIEEVKYDPKRKRIIPALQGQIKNLEAEFNIHLAEINNKKEIEKYTNLLSIGILNIT